MYAREGYMSVQLMRPDRAKFASGDWSGGTDEEIKEAARGYFAYSGPFHIDEEKKILTHSMFVSLDPNWLGQTQTRVVKLEGDMLHLSTEKSVGVRGQGDDVLSYLETS